MRKYEKISIDNYCIQELECRCNSCNYEFLEYTASNYELVSFEDKVGKKYFLPTYGKYGYLYLLGKLVDGWNSNERITKKISKKFEIKLREISPYDIVTIDKVRCPICKKDDIFVSKRNSLLNCPINWVEIDKKKVENLC